MQIMQIMEKKRYKRSIIKHGSHKTARSDAVRRAFSYDDRVIDCKIVYIIFFIVVIAYLIGLKKKKLYACILNGSHNLLSPFHPLPFMLVYIMCTSVHILTRLLLIWIFICNAIVIYILTYFMDQIDLQHL